MQTVEPVMITLNVTTRESCTSVDIMPDELVEGREYFELYFETFSELGSYSVNGSNSTEITINDTNG